MSAITHRLILTDPDTGEQVTTWLFGTTLETITIARNDVVSGKAIWSSLEDSRRPAGWLRIQRTANRG